MDHRAVGHDYQQLAHEAYLLGAFQTAEGWLYMVQDSGVGQTTFYPFAELRALVQEAQVVRFSGPVSL